MIKYGIDEYGRYIEEDGERYAVEPWPFEWWNFIIRVQCRLTIIQWYIGMYRQRRRQQYNQED